MVKGLLQRLARRLAPAPPAVTARARLALVVIAKNEGPYLLELVAWHRLQGVEKFYIVDNGSDDGSTALLAAMDRAGLIHHLPYPGTPGVAPQLPAYEMVMDRFRDQADWFAFFDADEFLRPDPQAPRFVDWLAGLPARVGAVGVMWAVYGSSGRVEPGAGTIHERFTRRATDGDATHFIFKSVVRARDWAGVMGHPHRFQLRAGRQFVDTSGARITVQSGRPGRARVQTWAVARLDHFVIKSRLEYDHKKRARGRAMIADGQRGESFFDVHDLNHVEDPTPPDQLQDLLAEMGRLRGLLAGLTPEERDLDLHLDRLGRASRE